MDGKVIGFGYIEGIDRPIQICIPMVGAIRVSSINISVHISLCIRVILGKSDVTVGTLVDKAISLLFVHIRFCLVVAVVLFSCRIIIGRYTHLQELGIIKSVSCIQGICLVCSIAVIVQLGLGVCSVKGNIALCRKSIIEGIIIDGCPYIIELIVHCQFQCIVGILLLAVPVQGQDAASVPEIHVQEVVHPLI